MDGFTATLLFLGGLVLIIGLVALWPDKKEKKEVKK